MEGTMSDGSVVATLTGLVEELYGESIEKWCQVVVAGRSVKARTLEAALVKLIAGFYESELSSAAPDRDASGSLPTTMAADNGTDEAAPAGTGKGKGKRLDETAIQRIYEWSDSGQTPRTIANSMGLALSTVQRHLRQRADQQSSDPVTAPSMAILRAMREDQPQEAGTPADGFRDPEWVLFDPEGSSE
jgi:hypothetical protein